MGGEIDMAQPTTLENFITTAATQYPASNYALVLDDHGGGYDGVIEGNHNDFMSLSQLSEALGTPGVPHLSLIGFSACSMGMTEVAYQMRNYADVMVGSESSEYGNGWDYSFVGDLAGDPSMTSAALGKDIVSKYGTYWGNEVSSTISAIDLTKVGGLPTQLVGAIDQFDTAMLISATSTDWNDVMTARSDAQVYDQSEWPYRDFVDLGSFMNHVQSSGVNINIATAARAVQAALKSAVISDFASSDLQAGTNGLTIYMPESLYYYDYFDPGYNSSLDFVADSNWMQFLDRETEPTTVTGVSPAAGLATGGSAR